MKEIEQINKEYYDGLYRKRSLLKQLIYPFISYDQQCKSKYNHIIARRSLGKVTKGVAVMDYGFGHGSFLLKMPKSMDLYGCDLSAEAVANFPAVAKLTGRKVTTFVPDDLDRVASGVHFKLICLSHVIEHVDDDEQLLKSLLPHLDHHGRLLINVPINEVWVDPKHVRKYTSDYMHDLAKRCGLTIEYSREAERWSAYFLDIEMVRKSGGLAVILQRAARLILAILPVSFVEFLERNFLSPKYKHQQLIMLLAKDHR